MEMCVEDLDWGCYERCIGEEIEVSIDRDRECKARCIVPRCSPSDIDEEYEDLDIDVDIDVDEDGRLKIVIEERKADEEEVS